MNGPGIVPRRSATARIAAVAVLGFFVVGAGFRLVDGPVNAATRADLSRQVSNLPCGPFTDVTCPGELVCYGGSYDPARNGSSYGFDPDRVGARVGPRCVTPTYVTGYCGFFETTGRLEHNTMAGCTSLAAYSPLPLNPLPYIDALLHREPGLIEQLRNPNNDGAALIHSYNLTLAREDPDASQTNVTPPDIWDLGIIRDEDAPDHP